MPSITETPITFPKMQLLITVQCSADLATAAKLPGAIFRLLRKLDVSAKVTLAQSPSQSVASGGGGGLMGQSSGRTGADDGAGGSGF